MAVLAAATGDPCTIHVAGLNVHAAIIAAAHERDGVRGGRGGKGEAARATLMPDAEAGEGGRRRVRVIGVSRSGEKVASA